MFGQKGGYVQEDYYDIAESDDLSKEDKEKVQDLAAELKNHTTILQSMMGTAGSKSKSDNKPDDKQKDDELHSYILLNWFVIITCQNHTKLTHKSTTWI